METKQTHTGSEDHVYNLNLQNSIVINGPWVELVLSTVLKRVLHLGCMDLLHESFK